MACLRPALVLVLVEVGMGVGVVVVGVNRVVVVVVMREVSRESVEENNKLELCVPSGSYSPSKW
jgi:hypothetical protein